MKSAANPLPEKEIRDCAELIRNAGHVLVAAGAGLSADAGIDYTDTASFAQRYPALVKRGIRMKAELIGYTKLSPEQHWGYWATHVNEVRFQAGKHQTYSQLFDLVSDKAYFVITSNADGMFVKNGFSEDCLFSPQGDYANMQCLKPCSNDTWATRPVIDRILPTVDPSTAEVTDPRVIPRCPRCGGPVFLNVRGGPWFIEDPYVQQSKRFVQWVRRSLESDLVVIEIGAGFNTPGVIRWRMEQIVHAHPSAHLIRVNPQYAEVPEEIVHKSVSLRCTAMTAITAISQEMGLR